MAGSLVANGPLARALRPLLEGRRPGDHGVVAATALRLVKGALPPPPRLLGWEECLEVLRTASEGYLALSQGALPLVVPVACALDGDQLLVRASLGLLGAPPSQPRVVAFHTSQAAGPGRRREVLVQGRAEPASPREAGLPPPLELVPDQASTVLSVTLELMKGQEYSAPGAPQPLAQGTGVANLRREKK